MQKWKNISKNLVYYIPDVTFRFTAAAVLADMLSKVKECAGLFKGQQVYLLRCSRFLGSTYSYDTLTFSWYNQNNLRSK